MTVICKTWWAALVLGAFVGCNEPTADTTNSPPPPTPIVPAENPPTVPAKPDADMPKDQGGLSPVPATPGAKDEAKAGGKIGEDELAEIKKLPADEQDAALKQVICPVSDEPLGSMGVPIKVTAEGKTFYLCCKGCNKDLLADPKAVVAKLNK